MAKTILRKLEQKLSRVPYIIETENGASCYLLVTSLEWLPGPDSILASSLEGQQCHYNEKG